MLSAYAVNELNNKIARLEGNDRAQKRQIDRLAHENGGLKKEIETWQSELIWATKEVTRLNNLIAGLTAGFEGEQETQEAAAAAKEKKSAGSELKGQEKKPRGRKKP